MVFDYQTCHPLRKLHGYQPGEALARLHNTIRPSFTYPVYTLQDVAKYDGKQHQLQSSETTSSPTVYFSSDGYVWDVSSSDAFLKGYSKFCGRDASFALAKMSMSADDVNRTDWDSLSSEEWESLKSWTKYFSEKYVIRGLLGDFQDQQQRGKR